jgi:hypothetical protein
VQRADRRAAAQRARRALAANHLASALSARRARASAVPHAASCGLQILRKIACDESDSLGDISTMLDPSIVQVLIDKVAELKKASQVRHR